MTVDTIKRWFNDHKITFALSGAIGIAILLTLVSMSLYIRSGASRLDLSRPGYEAAREQLVGQEEDTISPTGPVNEAAFKEFQKQFDSRRDTLNKLDPFSQTVVDNQSLRLMQ